jgi:hypothetical protein
MDINTFVHKMKEKYVFCAYEKCLRSFFSAHCVYIFVQYSLECKLQYDCHEPKGIQTFVKLSLKHTFS